MKRDDSAIVIVRPALHTPSPAPGAGPARLPHALILAGAFLVYASANAVVPIAGELRAAIGLGGAGAAIFLQPFAVGFGAGSVVWLLLARARGPRVVLPAALLLGAGAGVLVIAATTPGASVAARVLAGMAAAGYPAAAQAALASSVAPERRARMAGLFIACVVAGSFAGQAAAGLIAAAFSARAAIAVVCVVAPALLAVALARALAPAPAPLAPPRPPRLGPLVARQAPVLAVVFLAFGAYWMLLAQLPALLREERFHLSAAEAGLVPLVGLVGILAALAAGGAGDRRGPRPPALAALGAGIAGLALTLAPSGPLWLFAAAYGAFLAAWWGLLPAAVAEAVGRARPDERQAALLALYAAMWAGAALAPLAGAALGRWGPAAAAALAAWALAAVIASATFTRRSAS